MAVLGLTQWTFAAAWMWGGFMAAACAQGIYTCVDSKGRRITADRPIAECMDREQKELNSSGTVKRKIGPELTSAERAEQEEKARKAAEERGRANDERKREVALLLRYPGPESHDQERAAALAVVEGVIAAAAKRTQDLLAERKKLETEGEFYRNDPAKLPADLRRKMAEVDQQLAAQKRFANEQAAEKNRINARFDAERAKLKVLWSQQAAPLAARAASGSR